MECRLCGIYTKLEDLVVSLLDVGDSAVTFKEFAEHYLQRKLSNSASLPSLCCGTCQHQLVKFYRFSYNVDQHQIKLEKSLEQLPIQCSADDHPEQRELQKSQVHKEPKAELVEQPLQISRSVNVEVHNESLLQEVTTEEQRKPSRKRVHFDDTSSGPDKKRRKSLFHDEPSGSEKKAKARRNSFLDTPTNVMKTRRKSVILDKLSVFADKEDKPNKGKTQIPFNDQDGTNYFNIQIPKSKLLPGGECPPNWLKKFKNFKTWEDFNFTCDEHCHVKFEGLKAFIEHMMAAVKNNKRFITCHLCKDHRQGSHARITFRNFNYLTSYINHMTRDHFAYIKFCCVVCSKVFQNIKFLKDHYKEDHKTETWLNLWPCLECGAYQQTQAKLEQHFESRHKKGN